MMTSACTQTDIYDDAYEVVELKSRIEIQDSTVKTLKTLLGHAKEENEQLQIVRCKSACPGRMSFSQLKVDSESPGQAPKLERRASFYEFEKENEREVRKKEEALSQLKNSLACKTIENDALREKMSSLGKEMTEKSVRSSLVEKKATNLVSALNKRKIECADLVAKLESSISLREHESKLAGLSKELEVRCNENSALNEQIKGLTTQFDSARKEISESLGTIECLRRKIQSAECENGEFRAQIQEMEKEKSHAIKSLEKSHALAISLLEQTSGNAVLLAEKRLREVEGKLYSSEIHVTELLRSVASQERFEPTLNVAVQAVEETSSKDSQWDFNPRATACTQTEDRNQESRNALRELFRCGSCCRGEPQATVLFPCGHLLCDACTEKLIDSDAGLGGIACNTCSDNLPVTRLCRWRVPELLLKILDCI